MRQAILDALPGQGGRDNLILDLDPLIEDEAYSGLGRQFFVV